MDNNKIKGHLSAFKSYIPLLKQLVIKDIKLKYRRSFLGYLWSVLNPLMIMGIMTIVFSTMFNSDIQNFPVYLIIGNVLFSCFSETSNQAIQSITSNSSLLKKTYVPKYIFTLSKVTSSMINTIFALGAMLIVFVVCRVTPNWYMLLIPLILLELYLFCLGVGLFLAQANVFFRDIQYIWAAVLTAWMYFTPIFYPITLLPKTLQRVMKIVNPLYSYITQFRSIVIDGTPAEPKFVVYGIAWAVAALFFGSFCFLKKQDKFILYI